MSILFDRPAYLGLDTDQHWQSLLFEGIAQFGSHFSGSRNASYSPVVYDQLEKQLSKWLGLERCTTVSSGTLASILLLDSLSAQGYKILRSPISHVAWESKQSKHFSSHQAWVEHTTLELKKGNKVAILTDYLCPIRLKEIDLSWTKELNGDYVVVVDNSHGIAVTGQQGKSALSHLDYIPRERLLISASLGKAFSVPGAVIGGTNKQILAITRQAKYAGSSPIAIPYAATLNAGLEYALKRIEGFRQNITKVKKLLTYQRHIPGFPVFTLDEAQADFLRTQGLAISSLRYPTAQEELTHRLVLSYREKDLNSLLKILS